MTAIRKFRVATSLARLIAKGRTGENHAEGFFPESHDRSSMVRVSGDSCLASHTTKDGTENYEVALGHGRALLEICAGEGRVVFYERYALDIHGAKASLERILKPFPLDLLTFEFKDAETAMAFRIPPFAGQEVTSLAEFENRTLASSKTPPGHGPSEVGNDALNALLDVLEGKATRDTERPRVGTPRLAVYEGQAGVSAIESALGLREAETASG